MTFDSTVVMSALDITLDGSPQDFDALTGMAFRHNPRRQHLLVNKVTGKHYPQRPAVILDHAARLADRIGALNPEGPVVVVGYAEAAAGLAACVAEYLGSDVICTTRYPAPDAVPYGGFHEEHSHATAHTLTPDLHSVLDNAVTVVLVDDELTTGNTVMNTIAMLHERALHARYVVASLVDVRPAGARAKLQAVAEQLGTRIETVALFDGALHVPRTVTVTHTPAPTTAQSLPDERTVRSLTHPMYAPASLAAGTNRYGLLGLRDDAELIAHRAQEHVTGRTLVLGWEEDMYLPLQVAANLDGDISFGSTTRSPAIPLDIDGYGIRHALAFAVNDETRYAYNVNGYDTVIAVVDRHADTRGLTDALRTVTGRVLVVLTGELPTPLRGPYFGSYDTNEVAWLLTDVSDDAVEMDLNARETLVQNGGHYADSLPVEYEPTEDYLALYEQALTRNASRVALDVARACERLLAARRWPRHIILVSLARAGVPAGILMKRYLQSRVPHVEHYAVSIIRGRGIDENALDFIAAHHNVADVVFVDGWTGKGAIASELSAALMTYAQKTGVSFPTEVAVIADPAGVATYAGSPDDYLIPSAALNSTVSGLVSRTVLAPSLRAGDYHGAKFYVDLMGVDRSREFIEAVSAVLPSNPVFRPARTFMGTTSVVAGLCAEYGIESANRVKPGVAETTRALLRRVPWKVLIDPAAHAAEVAHIRQLAAERGVPVEECPVSPYAAVALIRDARTVS